MSQLFTVNDSFTTNKNYVLVMKTRVSDPSTWVVVRSSAGTSVCVVAELMDMESVLTRSQALDLSTQLNSIPFLIDCRYAPLKRKLLSYYWMSKIKD